MPKIEIYIIIKKLYLNNKKNHYKNTIEIKNKDINKSQ